MENSSKTKLDFPLCAKTELRSMRKNRKNDFVILKIKIHECVLNAVSIDIRFFQMNFFFRIQRISERRLFSS
ncbi:hypothetical protein BV917_02700 [Leptospira santarosai serovar Guaricura]|nr:hypothetical protein BV917_02700 [Leptospira santarosai serovar Guaricura]